MTTTTAARVDAARAGAIAVLRGEGAQAASDMQEGAVDDVTFEPVRRYESQVGRMVVQTAWCPSEDSMTKWSIRADRGGFGYVHLATHVVHEDRAVVMARTIEAIKWLDSDAGRQWYAAFCAEPIVAEDSADV